jgi:hypothetical protein
MRNFYLMLLLYGFTSGSVNSYSMSGDFNFYKNATREGSDQDQLIQQCLTFKPLVDKVPNGIISNNTVYYILNHGFDFTISSNLKANGKQISFLTKQELGPSKPYFLFHTLSIEGNTAFVRYYFEYTAKGVTNTIAITIDFEKNNGQWEITNYTI